MRALSIRQPFAELILSGRKTIEYRTRPTRIIGERFWIYASRQPAAGSGQKGTVWSKDLVVPTEPLPPWMIELAEGLALWRAGELPTGMIVGSAIIADCTRGDGLYHWHLTDVTRAPRLRKPQRHPQPVWFVPF